MSQLLEFPIRHWKFGDSAINKGYVAYFFNVHARNCLISTSGLKPDVIIVFIYTDFLYDVGITAIREHVKQKLAYLCLRGFSAPFGPKWRFCRHNSGRGGAMLTPNGLVLILGVVTSVSFVAKIDQEMRP